MTIQQTIGYNRKAECLMLDETLMFELIELVQTSFTHVNNKYHYGGCLEIDKQSRPDICNFSIHVRQFLYYLP